MTPEQKTALKKLAKAARQVAKNNKTRKTSYGTLCYFKTNTDLPHCVLGHVISKTELGRRGFFESMACWSALESVWHNVFRANDYTGGDPKATIEPLRALAARCDELAKAVPQ
jgi:hypothetical protein